MAVRAMKSGAVDFIEKPYTQEQMLERIHQALASYHTQLEDIQHRTQVAARLAQLTPREREVMNFLVQAYPNRLIAETLGIGERTVETHRQRIMDKIRAVY